MIMDDITVEGFTVRVTKAGNKFAMTVPSLPGVVGQVERKEQIRAEMGRLIRVHLEELARERPGGKMKRKPRPENEMRSGPKKINHP